MKDKEVRNRYTLVELAKEKFNEEYIDEGLTILLAKDKVESTVKIGDEKITVKVLYEKEHDNDK